MQPGLRRMATGAAQLTPTAPGSTHLAAKLAVLASHADQALLATPGFDPAPALRTLLRQASVEHPTAFAWDEAQQRLHALRLGWSVQHDKVVGNGPAAIGDCLRALPPPQRLLGLLCLAVEEDFAAIDGATGVISWLAVCLPSRWSPAEKIGLDFAEVHAPVADNRLLIAASDALTRLVTGGDRWERFVWTITPQQALDAHPDRCPAAAWPVAASAAVLAAHAWLRTEHQTFIPVTAQPVPVPGVPGQMPQRPAEREQVHRAEVHRAEVQRAGVQRAGVHRADLPSTREPLQAVFTIRIQVQPLVVVVDGRPRAGQLHAALASMSAAVLAYRGLTDARDRLLAWLEAQAA